MGVAGRLRDLQRYSLPDNIVEDEGRVGRENFNAVMKEPRDVLLALITPNDQFIRPEWRRDFDWPRRLLKGRCHVQGFRLTSSNLHGRADRIRRMRANAARKCSRGGSCRSENRGPHSL